MSAVDSAREIEAKFQVSDSALFGRLVSGDALLPGYALGAVKRTAVTDLYVDTSEYTLLRHGFQLRLRTQDDQRLVTLKSRPLGDTAAIYRRLEVEVPFIVDLLPFQAAELPEAVWTELSSVLPRARRTAAAVFPGADANHVPGAGATHHRRGNWRKGA